MPVANESFLKRRWNDWVRFGYWIGAVMSWVWMPLFYFILVMPIALTVKLFVDPLRLRVGRQKTYWTPKVLPKPDLAWAKSQGSGTVPGAK